MEPTVVRVADLIGFNTGDQVNWLHTPAGGYGYRFIIPAKVVGFGRGRVKIELLKNNGEIATRYVNGQSLTLRT